MSLAVDGSQSSGTETFLDRVEYWVDEVSTFVAVMLLGVMLISTLLGVFTRYVFNYPLVWTDSLSVWAIVWLVFAAMGVGTSKGSHVSIEMVALILPPGAKRAMNLFVAAVVSFVSFELLILGFQLATEETGTFAATLTWPQSVYYMAIPVSAAANLLVLLNRRVFGPRDRWGGPLSVLLGGVLYVLMLNVSDWGLTALSPTAVMLIVFCVALFGEVPVSFAMVSGAFIASQAHELLPGIAVVQQTVSGLDSYVLLAIPFFIFLAYIMNEGGITEQLIRVATVLVGHFRGGLAQVNVLFNLLMGGLSGSASGDAAASAKMLVPAMQARGYPSGFSCALSACGGIIDNVVPPAIAMLLYASLANVSLPSLMLAGYLPGAVLAGTLMVCVYIISRRRGYGADSKRATLPQVLKAVRQAGWAIGMPVIVIGGMRLGVMTPTEAGAVAVLYALLAMYFERGLNPRDLYKMGRGAILDTGSIGLIIAGSASFSWILIAERIPQQFTTMVMSVTTDKVMVLVLINIILFILGMPLEPAPAMLITIPIFEPLIRQLGIDPVHFGIVVIANLMIGCVTPPVGSLVFIVSTVTKVPSSVIFKEVIPMIIALGIGVLLITYVPGISLLVPSLLGGK